MVPSLLRFLPPHLDFGCDVQRRVPRRFGVLPLLLLSLLAQQVVEVGGKVAPQQRFLRGNVQQHGQSVCVKARLQHLLDDT